MPKKEWKSGRRVEGGGTPVGARKTWRTPPRWRQFVEKRGFLCGAGAAKHHHEGSPSAIRLNAAQRRHIRRVQRAGGPPQTLRVRFDRVRAPVLPCSAEYVLTSPYGFELMCNHSLPPAAPPSKANITSGRHCGRSARFIATKLSPNGPG